ncbi:MAG: Cellulose 1,4-beta-cellobiosidase, partial [Bacteroidetes bacterium]|nr:Cellulose 1,4-beta-cellobiosidase [Bacteroidota bacterium]
TGLKIDEPRYFIPPYEWYNGKISEWAKEKQVQLINFTPGTGSNADYTTPDMKSYRSSEIINNNILKYEENASLNGFMLLIHVGTHPDRTDKFYLHLDSLIKELKKKGYEFVKVDELLK